MDTDIITKRKAEGGLVSERQRKGCVKHTEGRIERQTNVLGDRQANRHMDRETEKNRHRETDRQVELQLDRLTIG